MFDGVRSLSIRTPLVPAPILTAINGNYQFRNSSKIFIWACFWRIDPITIIRNLVTIYGSLYFFPVTIQICIFWPEVSYNFLENRNRKTEKFSSDWMKNTNRIYINLFIFRQCVTDSKVPGFLNNSKPWKVFFAQLIMLWFLRGGKSNPREMSQ